MVGVVREAGIDRVTVVTGEPIDGYDTWPDQGLPWNDALAGALQEVRAPLAAVISADLPLLRAEEVEALLAATPARGIAIGRALDGGTNASRDAPAGPRPHALRRAAELPPSTPASASRTSSSTSRAWLSTSTHRPISRRCTPHAA